MGLEYVDIFYHHRPDPDTPLEETMGTLDLMVRQGKALYVGISSYQPKEAAKAIEILNRLGTPCLIHQPKYSMFERWVEKTSMPGAQNLLEVLEENGVGCIAFSPLAQGLLTDRYLKGIPEGSRASKAHGFLKAAEITEERIEQIRQLNEIAKKRNQSLAQMALIWLLKDKRITTVLIGASSVQQLDNNIDCLDNLILNDSELAQIEKILKKSPKVLS